MKNLLALSIAFIAVFLLMSCNDEKGDNPLLQARPEALAFGWDAGEPQDFYVVSSAGLNWEAEVEASAQEWLKITTLADKITVSVEKNTTDAARTGKITIKPDTNDLQPVEVIISQATARVVNIDVTKVALQFWGDYYDCGLSNYAFFMVNGDAEYKDNINQFKVNNGYLIYFDLFKGETENQDYQKIDLEEGTYKSSMDTHDENFKFEEMSFVITRAEEFTLGVYFYHSIIARFEEGKVVERFEIADGEINVKNDNGNYNISANLISADGEKIIINYAGEFDKKLNMVSESTYSHDLDLSGLNTGVLRFYGNDEDQFPELYNWYVIIDVQGYDDVSKLMLSLYSPMTSTTVLDDSSPYTISNDYPEPFLAEAGWLPLDIAGCWVFNDRGESTYSSPLIEGTVNVTHNSGDNYTIKVDALMDNYYTVKASFEGDLDYIDKTTQPAPPLKMPTAKAASNTKVKHYLIIDKSNLYK